MYTRSVKISGSEDGFLIYVCCDDSFSPVQSSLMPMLLCFFYKSCSKEKTSPRRSLWRIVFEEF